MNRSSSNLDKKIGVMKSKPIHSFTNSHNNRNQSNSPRGKQKILPTLSHKKRSQLREELFNFSINKKH